MQAGVNIYIEIQMEKQSHSAPTHEPGHLPLLGAPFLLSEGRRSSTVEAIYIFTKLKGRRGSGG